MQLIVKMPLLNITFPQNAATFYNFISEISSFDLIPTDKIDSVLFNFTDTEMEDSNFKQMGMEKYNVIQNLGSTLYYIVGLFLIAFLTVLLKLLKKKSKL